MVHVLQKPTSSSKKYSLPICWAVRKPLAIGCLPYDTNAETGEPQIAHVPIDQVPSNGARTAAASIRAALFLGGRVAMFRLGSRYLARAGASDKDF
jgi:hypothetical protein